jgi:hypothetical protein
MNLNHPCSIIIECEAQTVQPEPSHEIEIGRIGSGIFFTLEYDGWSMGTEVR